MINAKRRAAHVVLSAPHHQPLLAPLRQPYPLPQLRSAQNLSAAFTRVAKAVETLWVETVVSGIKGIALILEEGVCVELCLDRIMRAVSLVS